jgi:hypothetical protein
MMEGSHTLAELTGMPISAQTQYKEQHSHPLALHSLIPPMTSMLKVVDQVAESTTYPLHNVVNVCTCS